MPPSLIANSGHVGLLQFSKWEIRAEGRSTKKFRLGTWNFQLLSYSWNHNFCNQSCCPLLVIRKNALASLFRLGTYAHLLDGVYEFYYYLWQCFCIWVSSKRQCLQGRYTLLVVSGALAALCTCNHWWCLLVSIIDGACNLVHTLLSGDGTQGGAGVEVIEAETQEVAAAELIHQHGLALFKHI